MAFSVSFDKSKLHVSIKFPLLLSSSTQNIQNHFCIYTPTKIYTSFSYVTIPSPSIYHERNPKHYKIVIRYIMLLVQQNLTKCRKCTLASIMIKCHYIAESSSYQDLYFQYSF